MAFSQSLPTLWHQKATPYSSLWVLSSSKVVFSTSLTFSKRRPMNQMALNQLFFSMIFFHYVLWSAASCACLRGIHLSPHGSIKFIQSCHYLQCFQGESGNFGGISEAGIIGCSNFWHMASTPFQLARSHYLFNAKLVSIQGKGTEKMARKQESYNPKFCVVRAIWDPVLWRLDEISKAASLHASVPLHILMQFCWSQGQSMWLPLFGVSGFLPEFQTVTRM